MSELVLYLWVRAMVFNATLLLKVVLSTIARTHKYKTTLVDALSALLRVTVTVLPFAIFKQFLINKKAKYQQKTYQYMALIKFKLKQTIISRTKIFIGCINISQNV
jgi:hypothetical protein